MLEYKPMKNSLKIVLLLLLVVVIILMMSTFYKSKNKPTDLTPQESSVYHSSDNSFYFNLPAGWYAKPYLISPSTIFISPTEINFPGAWEGPLTPITVMKGLETNMRESIDALIENEPGLEVTEDSINGYKALRIKGVPANTVYLEGRYFEEVYLQKEQEMINISYIDRDLTPDYLSEFNLIVESVKF